MAKKDKDKGKGKGKGGGKGGKVPTPEQEAARKEKANQRALDKLYTREGNNAGNALINKFLPPGALGRVGTEIQGGEASVGRFSGIQQQYAGRSQAQNDVIARMQGGLDGYTSQENQAQREQMTRGINSNTLTSMSQLAKAQARGKVFGAAGVAQQENLIRGAQDTKDNLEQDLMIKNIDEKQRRLGEYGEYERGLTKEEYTRQADSTQAQADEEARIRTESLDREKVNLGQANAELGAQIGAYTGATSTALEERARKRTARIQRKALKAINS